MSITSTLIIQLIVFLLLVWFTMKFVWPPMAAALDERAAKIRGHTNFIVNQTRSRNTIN